MNSSPERLILLFPREDIGRRVRELAAAVNQDYAGSDLVLVGILRGSFVFMADLVRQLSIPVAVDFISAASYGAGTETSGQVAVNQHLQVPVSGRDVLVVEDIADTGITIQAVVNNLAKLEPRSTKICALIDKTERRRVDIQVDYVGFRIAQGFVVGYGIDYAERYRYLPDIYRIAGPGDSDG